MGDLERLRALVLDAVQEVDLLDLSSDLLRRRMVADAVVRRARASAREARAAVVALDAIDSDDPEGAHKQADGVLLAMVPSEVRDAYERLAGLGKYDGRGRAAWWATA